MNRLQTATPPGVSALSIPDVTLPEFVLGRAQGRGDKRAFVEAETGRELSHAQLSDAVHQWRACLDTRNAGHGDVIAVCAPNTLDFIIAVYGAMSTGAAVTPVNPMATAEEIERHLRRSGARRVITTTALYAQKVHTAARAANVPETYVIDEAAGHAESVVASSHAHPKVRAIPSDVALLPFSGGTTGPPKGVMLSHHSLVASLCQFMTASHWTDRDVAVIALPLFHLLPLHGIVNAALRAGASAVILPDYDIKSFVRAIEKYRVTRATMVPSIVRDLASSPVAPPTTGRTAPIRSGRRCRRSSAVWSTRRPEQISVSTSRESC
jgi:acyl-CoA synthetase (AMP-forming)/AMP-acid ligase II